jgi:hypothetical protein
LIRHPHFKHLPSKQKKSTRWQLKASYIFVFLDSLPDSQAALFQPSQKPVAGTFFVIKFVMSEWHEENEGSVKEFDAHSY